MRIWTRVGVVVAVVCAACGGSATEEDAGRIDAGGGEVDAGMVENPFRATTLEALAAAVTTATEGQGTPSSTPLAIVPPRVVPFFIPAQIGAGRAASEIGTPFTFDAPLQEPTDTND